MDSYYERYSRQVLLRVIGETGQMKLSQARVLIAGLGALGSLNAILLARSGVGFLRIVDQDSPELHNLHRQLLYDESDVDSKLSKAQIAATKLRASSSAITIEPVTAVISSGNVEDLTDGVDLVVDALDNMPARYALNDSVLRRGIPYVFGGAVETVGNVMTIIPGVTPCLRCIWPDPSKVINHARASTVGVLASAATAVSSIQVAEAVKLLVGKPEVCLKGLLFIDLWSNHFHEAPIVPNPSCECRSNSRKVC
jgi:molybdopterin-synthase adenylyltransferase